MYVRREQMQGENMTNGTCRQNRRAETDRFIDSETKQDDIGRGGRRGHGRGCKCDGRRMGRRTGDRQRSTHARWRISRARAAGTHSSIQVSGTSPASFLMLRVASRGPSNRKKRGERYKRRRRRPAPGREHSVPPASGGKQQTPSRPRREAWFGRERV
jgi:hypothetical protein